MKTWPRNTIRDKNICWCKPLKPVKTTPHEDPSPPGILEFGLQGQCCRVRIGTALLSLVLGLLFSPLEEEGKENGGGVGKRAFETVASTGGRIWLNCCSVSRLASKKHHSLCCCCEGKGTLEVPGSHFGQATAKITIALLLKVIIALFSSWGYFGR